MTEYRTDKQEMLDIEKERREFYRNEQIRLFGEVKVEDITLDLNYKNKACKEAVGMKMFKASQFVRKDGSLLIFKRAIDSEETALKASWIKNLRDIEWFINR